MKTERSGVSAQANAHVSGRYAGAKGLACIALFTAAFAAFGHGGEDHGAPPPAIGQDVAPRAAAATEDFEVVAALEGRHLVVYVDRCASNDPVATAKVEVDGAGLKGLAAEAAPGTYVMDLAATLPPAKHALTISIEAADSADLLTATLDTSLATPGTAHVHGWSEWIVWTVAVVPLLATRALPAAPRGSTRSRRCPGADPG